MWPARARAASDEQREEQGDGEPYAEEAGEGEDGEPYIEEAGEGEEAGEECEDECAERFDEDAAWGDYCDGGWGDDGEWGDDGGWAADEW